MKRKILVSILMLSICSSMAGCQTASRTDEANDETRVHTDTDTANEKGITTDTDTVIEKNSSKIDTDDVKELQTTDTDIAEESKLESEAEQNTDTENNNDDNDNKNTSPEPSSIEIGGTTVEAELVPLDESMKISDKEKLDSIVVGNTVYILDNKTIHTDTRSEGAAVKGDDIKLPSKYDKIDSDVYGNIYLSNKSFNAAILNDDMTVSEIDLTGSLAMSKVMNFGLNCLSDGALKKYADSDTEDWYLGNTDDEDSPFNKITDVEFVGNHILVGGNFDDGKNTQRVAVYDYDGNQIALTDNKISGNKINSMTETQSSIVVTSSGSLSLWNLDGTEIGQTKSGETAKLFGTENPVWITDVISLDDGSVLAVCTTENNDDKTEAYLYKLWGI